MKALGADRPEDPPGARQRQHEARPADRPRLPGNRRQGADKIGQLNISPDLLRELLDAKASGGMNRLTENKIVLVTRARGWPSCVARFNTGDQARFYVEHLGADFDDYEREDRTYQEPCRPPSAPLRELGRVQVVHRAFLPNFVFGAGDTVVALGQDGLVANMLKYLDGQPLIGVNPDPARWDGALLRFKCRSSRRSSPRCSRGSAPSARSPWRRSSSTPARASTASTISSSARAATPPPATSCRPASAARSSRRAASSSRRAWDRPAGCAASSRGRRGSPRRSPARRCRSARSAPSAWTRLPLLLRARALAQQDFGCRHHVRQDHPRHSPSPVVPDARERHHFQRRHRGRFPAVHGRHPGDGQRGAEEGAPRPLIDARWRRTRFGEA